MVMTYKQGLSVLAVSFLAAVLGGCTYNEDDLRGVHQDNLQDASAVDLATTQIEADANSPIDAEGVDAGLVVDVAGGEVTPRVDASEIDASADAFSSTGIDASSSIEINDSGSVDHQSVDVSPADVSDLSIDSHDSNIDLFAVDVQVSEAGGMDGAGKAD
jgi:hypothetical protein